MRRQHAIDDTDKKPSVTEFVPWSDVVGRFGVWPVLLVTARAWPLRNEKRTAILSLYLPAASWVASSRTLI